MDTLNTLIHQPVRLRIMAMLVGIGIEADFVYMKQLLALTDGNLGSHLSKLEKAGYIEINKTFSDRKPKTYIKVSKKGKKAYLEHADLLKQIIESGDG